MIVTDIRPLLAVAFPLVASLLILFSGKKPNIREAFSIIAAVGAAICALSMSSGVVAGNVYEFVLCPLTDTLSLTLRVDYAGELFACVSSFLYVVVAFYAIGYMRGHHEKDQTGFFAFFAICICSAIGIAYSANLLTFFVFFEMLTIATWPLVFHERNDEAKFSGRKYLVYTLIPGQLLLVGIVIVYAMSGTLDFVAGGFMNDSMGSKMMLSVVFFLLVGAGAVKAGMMPLHGWLPSAMVAPTPVSALLHAVAVVKAGAFGVIRIIGYVYGPEVLSGLKVTQILAVFACVTIIASSLIAFSQDNLKRRLAYSTIGQLSYVVLGACMLTSLGMRGAFFQIVAHAFMKITLFMVAGAIIVTAHKDNVSQMNGIGKAMPFTMIAFAIGSFGIIGVPFFNGFVSKWNLLRGAIQGGMPIYVVVLLISAMLGISYLVPVIFTAFFPKNKETEFKEFHEANPFMLVPIMITGVLSVVMGINPNFGPHLYDLATLAAEAVMKGAVH